MIFRTGHPVCDGECIICSSITSRITYSYIDKCSISPHTFVHIIMIKDTINIYKNSPLFEPKCPSTYINYNSAVNTKSPLINVLANYITYHNWWNMPEMESYSSCCILEVSYRHRLLSIKAYYLVWTKDSFLVCIFTIVVKYHLSKKFTL